MKELNFELLKSLYSIHSESGNEKRMRRFIKAWIKREVPTAVVTRDGAGNIYVTKGVSESYPCLCAHMDQVQHFHPKDFMCIDGNGVILGYSPKTRRQCGLGADDKNGIFIALTCLAGYDVLKCAFFVGEEVGCVGSEQADMSFFEDCRFCAQIDRRGNSDLVTEISDSLCSDAFVKAADPEAWGYSVSYGAMTDVDTLRERGVAASCVNMSCGYYEPHTDREFTVKEDVAKCYRFVCHLIEDCTDSYPFRQSSPWYTGGASDAYAFEDCISAAMEFANNEPFSNVADFFENAKGIFPTLSKADIYEAYDVAKSYM